MSIAKSYIDESREAALDVLKPSKKDLEHGLELHRQALVIETYGFGPRSSSPKSTLEAVRAGLVGNELKDVTERVSQTGYVHDPVKWEAYKEIWKASGVTCVFCNTGEEGQDPLEMLRRFSHFQYVTEHCRSFVSKAVVPDDIAQAHKEGRHCLVFTTNGVPLVQDWQSVEDEFRYLRFYAYLGCRMMHITYNRRNMLGDGCAETANGGLSDFGRLAVAEMNRLGMIIDVSHAGWQTSMECAQLSEKPMVASHTVCGALSDHVRSKPDDVMKAIADTNGLVGICSIPYFLGGSGDLSALIDHIDHARKTIGADHVGIGTDVNGSIPISDEEKALYKELEKEYPFGGSTTFRSLWPKDNAARAAKYTDPRIRRSLAWVNFPYITVGMVQRGFKDDEILKILGSNMLRVFSDALPEEERSRVHG